MGKTQSMSVALQFRKENSEKLLLFCYIHGRKPKYWEKLKTYHCLFNLGKKTQKILTFLLHPQKETQGLVKTPTI